MQKVSPASLPSTAEMITLSAPQLIVLVQSLAGTVQSLQHQLEWFKRQMFGRKSERFAPQPDAQQMHLGQVVGDLPVPPAQPDASSPVPAHKRRKPRSDFADDGVGASFFDEAKVPDPPPEGFMGLSRGAWTNLMLVAGFYFFVKFVRYAIWSWAP